MRLVTNFFKREKKQAFDYFEEVGRWWRHFNAEDDKRTEQDVYYLPCNLETEANINSARMDFTIREDKPVLISISNAYAPIGKKDGIIVKKAAYDAVKNKIDSITDKKLMIDEVDMSDHAQRIRSDFFELDEDHKAITDGYWLALDSFAFRKGLHTIYRSSCDKSGKSASTSYNITVV